MVVPVTPKQILHNSTIVSTINSDLSRRRSSLAGKVGGRNLVRLRYGRYETGPKLAVVTVGANRIPSLEMCIAQNSVF